MRSNEKLYPDAKMLDEAFKINVQPYEWASSDKVTRKTETADSERLFVGVDDYYLFCRIELPHIVQGKKIKWNLDALKTYSKWLRGIMKEDQPIENGIIFKEMHTVEKYETTYPFLICKFENETAVRNCFSLIDNQVYQIPQLGFIKSRVW